MQSQAIVLAVASAFLAPLSAQCVPPGASQFQTLYQGTTYLGTPDPVYGANMLFDLNCSVDITVTSLALNLLDDGVGTNPILVGEQSDVVIWTFPTTWVANHTVGTGGTTPATPPGWTQVGAGIMTIAASNSPSVVALNAPFTLLAGTYGVAIQHLPTLPSVTFPTPQTVHPLYTNPAVATGTPTVWSDQFITLTAGAGQGSAFQSGVAQPRVINMQMSYQVAANTAYTTNYGTSCYDKPQSFYEVFPAPSQVDLPGLGMQNLGVNYVVTTGGAVVPFNTGAPGSIHVNNGAPGVTGTPASAWDDANSAPIPLPATWVGGFPYVGGASTAIEINSNGVIWLQTSTRTAAFYNGVNAMLNGSASIIGCYGDWEPADHALLTGSGEIYYDVGPSDAYVAITFDQVMEWNQPGTSNTFQIVMTPAGGVTFAYGVTPPSCVAAPMMVGFTPGGGVPDPGSVDFSVAANPALITGDGQTSASLSMDARPIAGTTPNFVTSGIDPGTNFSATLLNFTPQAGLDLTLLGVDSPGCKLWIGLAGQASIGLQIGGAATHTVPFSIPGGPQFIGTRVYAQAGQLLPGVSPSGIVTTNGVCIEIGN